MDRNTAFNQPSSTAILVSFDRNNVDNKPTYIVEWNLFFYCDVMDQYSNNNALTFESISDMLFSNPTTLQAFTNKAIAMVSPLTLVLNDKRLQIEKM